MPTTSKTDLYREPEYHMPNVTSDGVRIHYKVDGDGPPLVLVHGFMGSAARWRETGYVDALRDAYRVIAVDTRGHGDSDKPHHATSYSYQHMAADVLSVLDDLGIEWAHVWGYSMGGGVGFRLGRMAPDRVRSLILGGSHPFAMTDRQIGAINAMRDDLQHGIEAFVSGWEQRAGPLPQPVRAAWLAQDGLALAAVQDGLLPDNRDGMAEPFDDLAMPCLLYGGTADEFTSELPRAAELLPHAVVVLLGRLDHAGAFRSRETLLPYVTTFLAHTSR